MRRAPLLMGFGIAAMAAGAASLSLSAHERLTPRVLVLTAVAIVAVVVSTILLLRRR